MDKQSQEKQHTDFGDVVSSYTRADALSDGVLIDAGEMAHEVGFRWPVALTVGAWADCVVWHQRDSEAQVHQDEAGRLWDVLFMASLAARHPSHHGEHQLYFDLLRVPRDGHSTEAVLTTLKLVVGPGDVSEPVITILLPGED